MTTIGSVIPAGSSSSAVSDNNTLINNYETFLTLLTTQLRNQDPMEPMDSNQFTQQLVQYSAVEQQIKANEKLDNLAAMTTANNALSALNFVDKTVTIDGTRGYLNSSGKATFSFDAEQAGKARMIIRNANGDIVANVSNVSISKGSQTWDWKGTDAAGNRMPKGDYSVQIDATTTDGDAISINSDSTGTVTNVDVSSSEPMLTVNNQTIKMSQIKSVS